MVRAITALGILLVTHSMAAADGQITFTPKHHNLDNNDNFSPDGRYLCYDTRGMAGPGIENCQSIEKVEIASGEEIVLYAPGETISGVEAAPGVGAVSYSFIADEVAFIHGPPVASVSVRGYYAKSNRNGASVPGNGSGRLTWLDHRDVAVNRDTLPGAHRGGTHRHEYSRNGLRIGFTYDDHLMPEYDRTIGYLEQHPNAPGGASHYFAILAPVVPMGTASVGEIERAYGDSWVSPDGSARAFIGKVREEDGRYEESLFVAAIPDGTDITTADSGSASRFPSPPKGVTIRRMTHAWAGGIVRGSAKGDYIAYYGTAADGTTQIFVVPVDGGDRDGDPAKRPRQVTRLPHGAGPGLRWHPSGDYVACISNNGVAVTALATGETEFLTGQDDGPERLNLVWSHDGTLLAYNRAVPHPSGAKAIDGSDFLQIFTVSFRPE